MELGNIHGAPAKKFGLYYGKWGDDTIQKYRFSKKFGESADEAMNRIRKELVMLLIAGNNDEHLTYFMQNLEIDLEPGDDVLVQQRKLLEWMKKRPECKNWRAHDFSNFLYDAFGRPFSNEKGSQDERDKEYPVEYRTEVNINLAQWKEMLKNPKIFKEEDITLLKRFYKADNHATTCYDLGVQDSVSPSTYIKPIVALARRVEKATGISPIYNNKGKQVWWRIVLE